MHLGKAWVRGWGDEGSSQGEQDGKEGGLGGHTRACNRNMCIMGHGS